MSEAKHTPRPWRSDSEYGTAIVGADGTTVASVLNPINATKRQHPVPKNVEQIKANARLIEAAPDLLETLAWVRANYAGGSTVEINARIEAAIAKAEGRS